MGLVNLVTMVKCAEKRGGACPAFNIDNLESAMAVAEVMKETGIGVIVQTIPRTLNYGSVEVYPAMINALMADSNIDYCLHLDHGNGLALANLCVAAGFSSIMFDGSYLPLEENVAVTKEIRQALPRNISLEAELGAIGGKEETEGVTVYTDPKEAAEFIKLTACDLLAIGVGTAHGVYKGVPVIRTDLIEKIKEKTGALLVLHGASGLNDRVVRDCVKAGIGKINFATELRQAYTDGIIKGMKENPGCFDPKVYMRTAVDEIKKTVLKKVELCLNF